MPTTLAVLVSVPGVWVVTWIVIVTFAWLAIVPIEQSTETPDLKQLPCVVETETNVTFAGRVSLTATPLVADGPALWTPSVYVSCWPVWIGSGESVFVSSRSAAGSTVVDALAELFDVLRSPASEVMLAWFVTLPSLCGRILMSMLALPPLVTVPSAQVTVPLACEQVPCDGVAESKVVPAGRVSVTVVPVAVWGPAFETPKV